MPDKKPDLRDVTVCVANSAFVDHSVKALERSVQQVNFGDAILFSDTPRDGPFRFVKTPVLSSIEAYSAFCLRQMVDAIKTPYVLIVQWDGFVINARAWANAFRKYDYIGAAWHGLFPPDRMVGNGGFSLRSRRLLSAVKQLPISSLPEDRTICHLYREKLERDFGLRFAPVKIADRFAYEYRMPDADNLPFGFHGVYHLWRHLDDADLLAVAEQIEFTKIPPDRIVGLAINCARNGKDAAAACLIDRIWRRATPDRIHWADEAFEPNGPTDSTMQMLKERTRAVLGGSIGAAGVVFRPAFPQASASAAEGAPISECDKRNQPTGKHEKSGTITVRVGPWSIVQLVPGITGPRNAA